jgi:hypothetical protein
MNVKREAVLAGAGLRGVAIRARTDGLVLEAALQHRFRNTSDGDIEVSYSFPVPTDAAVLSFGADHGGQRSGATASAADAAAYEAAIERGGAAAQLDRLQPGRCNIALGRLRPGEATTTVTVWARFLEVVDGTARIVAPVSAMAPEGSSLAGPFGPEGAGWRTTISPSTSP